MKLSLFKCLALAALAPVLASAQTPAQNNAQMQQQQQALAMSQQANQLLANPSVLFSQLDVDNDGLLNLNEFAQIAALSTRPVVVPGTNGAYAPNNGVAPVTTPNGAYTPNTGVPPPNVRSGATIPNTAPAIPTRPSPN